MTSIYRNPEGPQDPVHLARTLRRIKRRLLLEQCGQPLPKVLQNTPPRIQRQQVLRQPVQMLQSKPQALVRSDSGDSATIDKMGQPRVLFSSVTPASPSME